MSIHSLSSLHEPMEDRWVAWDRLADRLPLVSTIMSIANLLIKSQVIPLQTTHPYYQHLTQKSVPRCLLLLLPFLGNFFVWMDDDIEGIIQRGRAEELRKKASVPGKTVEGETPVSPPSPVHQPPLPLTPIPDPPLHLTPSSTSSESDSE